MKRKTEKLPSGERKTFGEWTATRTWKAVKGPGGALNAHSTTVVTFRGTEFIRGHGEMFWNNAVEQIERWHKSGYSPKPAKKTLGDYSEEKRGKVAIKNAATKTGPGFNP